MRIVSILSKKIDIVIKDEWGRENVIKATKGNLEQIKSWSEER